MGDISKTRKIRETALTVEITLMDLDKMDVVTWHKFSQVSFVRGGVDADDDDGRTTDGHVGDPIGSPCEPKMYKRRYINGTS